MYLTDASWLCVVFSASFGSKSEGTKEEKEIQRKSSDTHHSFSPSANLQKKCFPVHLSLTNICRDVISHQNDQMHWREPVNNKKAAAVSWQTDAIVNGICS